jgi:ubiquinone/menaquinone biosynthesis C-methylase UbiE
MSSLPMTSAPRYTKDPAMPDTPGQDRTRSVARGFDKVAKHYDNRWLQQWVYRRPQDAVLDELRTRGSRRIVDVGCGTGLLADRIQRRLRPDEVYGVDPSEGMLAHARARSADVQWMVGSAEHLPLPDSSVDAITSTTAFHFFDQAAALTDFHRALVPGGIVAVATIDTALPSPTAVEWLLERSPFPARHPSRVALRNLFENAGFEIDRQFVVTSAFTRMLWIHRVTIGVKPSR